MSSETDANPRLGAGKGLGPGRLFNGRNGTYELVSEIGKGSTSVVHRALLADSNQDSFALKFLVRAPTITDAEWRGWVAQFSNESRLGQNIRSKRIARVIDRVDLPADFDEPDGPKFALVFTYYTQTLEKVLTLYEVDKDSRIPDTIVRQYALDLARSLKDFHDEERVHRDLRAANVFVETDRTARRIIGFQSFFVNSRLFLGDYGMCCAPGASSVVEIGRDETKAPELFVPGHNLQPATYAEDLYALGKLLGRIAAVAEGEYGPWLLEFSKELTVADPARRPRLDQDLIYRIENRSDSIVDSPESPTFCLILRDDVHETFRRFADESSENGGVFFIEGPSGIGKSTLIRNWPKLAGDELHVPFYFNQITRPFINEMIGFLFESIRKVYFHREEWERRRPSHVEASTLALGALLRLVSEERLVQGKRILIFIDAVDQSEDPELVAESLPQSPVPKGIFFLVTATKECAASVMLRLREKHFAIEPKGPANRSAVASYFLSRIRPDRRPTAEQAERLTHSIGGLFKPAVYLAEELDAGNLTVAEFLARDLVFDAPPPIRRILSCYQEWWRRLRLPLTDDQKERLDDFMTLLAASFDAMNRVRGDDASLVFDTIRRNHAQAILGWTPTQMNSMIERVGTNWIENVTSENEHGERFETLRLSTGHGFRFLTESPGGPAASGLSTMHARIARYSLELAKAEGWPALGSHGLVHLIQHVLRSNDHALLKKAEECLTNLEFIQARLTVG